MQIQLENTTDAFKHVPDTGKRGLEFRLSRKIA